MAHDQCPSSKKEGRPVHGAGALSEASGRAYWRGLDDLTDSGRRRDYLEREFQDGAAEINSETRRDFLKVMGAGLALAGISTMPGCRRPDHKILPYSKNVPEHIVPGKSLYYATSMPLPGGGAEGLLIETHEGRPTKVEGNPLHPINQGKSSVWSQASILDLYDPDRLARVMHTEDGKDVERTWEDFGAWATKHFAQYKQGDGAGLAFVCDYKTSPTLDAMRARVKAKWPNAVWVSWNSMENRAAAEGIAAALGRPMHERLMLDKASVIVSLDRDFLGHESASLVNVRQFARTRMMLTSKDEMSRLYAAESYYSITGGMADHRLRLAPSQVTAFAVALASEVLSKQRVAGSQALAAAIESLKGSVGAGIDGKFVKAAAEDLMGALGKGLVTAGASQPAAVHALCAALNGVLGNIGKTVAYAPAGKDEGSCVGALKSLCDAMSGGKIKTIVTLGANPCFDAPADLDFDAKFRKVPERIALSVDHNETVAGAGWKLNGTHYLEQWGDTVAADGTVAPIQPMIAPLYGGMSDIEMLAIILGTPAPGYELVRQVWRDEARTWFPRGAGDFEKMWRRALHDGVLAGAWAPEAGEAPVAHAAVATLVGSLKIGAAPSQSAMEVVFHRGPMHDGRWLNNGWMQELPDTASRVVWDNVALVSPATAQKLGVHQTDETDMKPQGRVADVTVNGRGMKIPCWAMPGIPDNTVILTMGYGRREVGLVGEVTGFDVFGLRTSAGLWSAAGATLAPTTDGDAWYHVVVTQLHGSMEGRAVLREMELAAWKKHGDQKIEMKEDAYGRVQRMSLAEQIEGSEFNHMPAAVPIYDNPLRNKEYKVGAGRGARATKDLAAFDVRPQWGMTIDLSTCTGCNVCTIACQAENNIPIVGKTEVNKGRVMHWIRVDRYFKSEGNDPEKIDGMVYQPVACVHCENAPCETVCPVNATTHGEEGHNFMVYNRCIGTRYCANNCPYKVRRFNFFDYGVTKFKGPYFGQDTIESLIPGQKKGHQKINPNLIPPRLRKKLDEISKMQKNPNVTVRSRGVMEKCTYCIQRTNEAKIDLKLRASKEGKDWRPEDGLPDGVVQTACQQACPSNSIVFGDILDTTSNEGKGSAVRQLREHHRSYMLLGFLATAPRTTHLARVNNSNPALRRVDADPFGHHGGHESGGGHEGGGGGAKEHTFVDPGRAGKEGYVMSLGVLGARS